jgi:hypothetical protein
VVLENIYSEIAQLIKEEDFVINVDQINITIKIVRNKLMNLLIVFIVGKKVILPENVLAMKKVFIEKVVHVLVVAL